MYIVQEDRREENGGPLRERRVVFDETDESSHSPTVTSNDINTRRSYNRPFVIVT